MARQPILDRRQKVVAYELLYRSGNGNSAGEMNDEANLRALANVAIEIGLDRLVGNLRAYINVPPTLADSPVLRLLPPSHVVLELLETFQPTKEAFEAVRELKKDGYTLAFDDFVFEGGQGAFVPFVDLVKVDVMHTPAATLSAQVPKLKRAGKKLLAEKVETHEMHKRCLGLGFDYFQGYFFAKPATISSKNMQANRVTLMRLLARLYDPNVSYGELESLVASDVAIAYRLLRLINSAAMGMDRKIESVREAIMLIGIQKVASVATLIALSTIEGKPSELVKLSMVRARMAERIAQMKGHQDPSRHFTVGLFSTLEAFMDAPMDSLVETLPLSQAVKDVLTAKNEDLSEACVLRAVKAFERGEWEEARIEIDLESANQAYREAVQWSNAMQSNLVD